MKLNLGCGMPPFRSQDNEAMGNPDEWVWVDLFVRHERVVNWDAQTLDEVADDSIERIYSSHMLEHISHRQVPQVLGTWNRKLVEGGILTLNVPDMEWVAEAILGKQRSRYFQSWWGEAGWVSVLYGLQDHDGEYHKSGFTQDSLREILNRTGYGRIEIQQLYDQHEQGCLIANAVKQPGGAGG